MASAHQERRTADLDARLPTSHKVVPEGLAPVESVGEVGMPASAGATASTAVRANPSVGYPAGQVAREPRLFRDLGPPQTHIGVALEAREHSATTARSDLVLVLRVPPATLLRTEERGRPEWLALAEGEVVEGVVEPPTATVTVAAEVVVAEVALPAGGQREAPGVVVLSGCIFMRRLALYSST